MLNSTPKKRFEKLYTYIIMLRTTFVIVWNSVDNDTTILNIAYMLPNNFSVAEVCLLNNTH